MMKGWHNLLHQVRLHLGWRVLGGGDVLRGRHLQRRLRCLPR